MVEFPQLARVDDVLHAPELVVQFFLLRVAEVGGKFFANGVVAVEDRAGFGHTFIDNLCDGFGRIELRFLGQVSDAGVFGPVALAHVILVFAGHNAQQGGFTRAVPADHPDFRAKIKREVDLVQDRRLVVLLRQFLQVKNIFAGHTSSP